MSPAPGRLPVRAGIARTQTGAPPGLDVGGPAFAPGQVVLASDRGNYGRVVRALPGGRAALVHFRSPDGSEASVALPVSKLRPAGRAAAATDPNAPRPAIDPIDVIDGLIADRLSDGRRRTSANGDEGSPSTGGSPSGPEPPADGSRLARIRARAPERPRPGPCWACRGTRFWLSTCGVVVCATCHPPACPEFVKEWIEAGAEAVRRGPVRQDDARKEPKL